MKRKFSSPEFNLIVDELKECSLKNFSKNIVLSKNNAEISYILNLFNENIIKKEIEVTEPNLRNYFEIEKEFLNRLIQEKSQEDISINLKCFERFLNNKDVKKFLNQEENFETVINIFESIKDNDKLSSSFVSSIKSPKILNRLKENLPNTEISRAISNKLTQIQDSKATCLIQ